jgi:ATP-binding cassette subfamily C (CFTR/MRP) protein 1
MIHAIFVKNIINAPLTFFDVVPFGRILSRLSKDTDVVDNTIYRCVGDGIVCAVEVMSST